MELRELGGIENETALSALIPDDQELSGTDDNEFLAAYETAILGRVSIVEPHKAEVVLYGNEAMSRTVIAALTKEREVLAADKKNNGIFSQSMNIDVEIDVFDQILASNNLELSLKQAANSKSYFALFFGALLENLQQNTLNGLEDEPVYLGRIEATNEEELGKIKIKVPKIIKKGIDVLKKISPTAILMRSSALVVIRANVFRIADKLAIGYMTEEQAKAKGYNVDAWKEFVAAREKFESKWSNLGGKTSALKNAVINGKAGKKAGLKGELGVVVAAGVTAALAAATPVVIAIKEIFGKLSIKKVNPKDEEGEGSENGEAVTDQEIEQIKKSEMENAKSEEKQNLPANQEQNFSATPEKKGFFAAVQENVKNNKKWWIIGTIGVVLLIILIVWLVKRNKKSKAKPRRRSLNGTKTTTRRRTTRKKSLNGLAGANNGLKALHAKAKRIKAQHPKMKYSTALKKAKRA